jgi:hypothetical protein
MSHELRKTALYCLILISQPSDFKSSYCFPVVMKDSHNRLVAGSSPAGATKHKGLTPKRKPLVFSGFMNQRRG